MKKNEIKKQFMETIQVHIKRGLFRGKPRKKQNKKKKHLYPNSSMHHAPNASIPEESEELLCCASLQTFMKPTKPPASFTLVKFIYIFYPY